jgi:hypothetical protein
VKKNIKVELDFEIDALTNSIRNTVSGDSFRTEVLRLTTSDLNSISKISGWNFNWSKELEDNSKEVFKLTIIGNPTIR